ncbi:Fasciculation and elongation protein zeta-2 [Armadillidium nasatum]|uniref:Fasciculation and elongation protein zeta-2 n=1 Tax=Armadillidium nasatum TaxID=96803 RepID=A0A5N5T7K8_9CRUS|nr:Fasciculation and elongation protein zeta-2 [Armadillidium nasatum]
MASNKRHFNGQTKRSPSVFERLSKDPQNKPNDLPRSSASFGLQSTKTRGQLPSSSDKKKRSLVSNNNKKISEKRNVTAKTADAVKKDSNDEQDSFQEKVLMENVPETTDKDLDDLIHEGKTDDITNNDCNLNNNMSDNYTKEDQLKSLSEISDLNDIYRSENYTCDMNRTTNSLRSKNGLNTVPSVSKSAKTIECCSPVINDVLNLNQDLSRHKNFDPNLDVRNHCSNVENNIDTNLNKNESIVNSKYKENIEDEKDICDAESELDENEFYKVKVQTRLVSYENSTLFIRNTSKQSLDSQNENELPSQNENELSSASSLNSFNESLSSASLQDSLSVQEPIVFNEAPTQSLEQKETVEQTKLGNVKNRLGNLMRRGKSMLNDVYKSSYVPDVKSSINKIHGVTRRSLQTISSSWKGGSAADLDKFDIDSGFSSLSTSAYEPIITQEEKPILKLLETDARNDNEETDHEMDAPHAIYDTNDREAGSETDRESLSRNENTLQDADPLQDEAQQADYSNFFSQCSCRKDDNCLKGREEICCSCQEESEFPLEIKELLDADYARMWWTITGNFGNILPIDWSKTYTRQKYLPVLNLNESKKLEGNMESVTPSPREDDDEEVAHDLDLHQLILAGTQQEDTEPVKSAEEVIKEIDDIMQLKDLSINELNETLMEYELVIRRYSETLISQLAHRDELEYEKELKNTFISLLLQVQNKRRNYNVEKKKTKKPLGPNGTDLKYLTTVIPYDVGHGPPDNETIHILIKILTAINEDSPTVPTLLTDYILRVLCPS